MRKFTFILIAISLLVFKIVQAKDVTSNTLLQYLSLVPDIPEARDMLSYVDYREMEASRSVTKPTLEDFKNKTDLARLWFSMISGTTYSGFFGSYQDSDFNAYDLAQDMPNKVGFSFLDIDKALFFGEPKDSPKQVLILNGNFDTQKIAEAFTQRGFNSTNLDKFTLWCKTAKCESATPSNDIDVSNPFGGRLGMQNPVLVSTDYLASSSDAHLMQVIENNFNNPDSTLADIPEYQSIADVISNVDPLIQIQFFNPAIVGKFDVAKIWAENSILKDATRLKTYIDYIGTLPAYSLAALAQTYSADNEIVVFALAYQDKTAADTAAQSLMDKLPKYFSETLFRPMSDALSERGVKDYSTKVEFDEQTGQYVVLLPFASPKPSNEIHAPDINAPPQPGGIYRLWMNEFWKGTPFLATEFILPSN